MKRKYDIVGKIYEVQSSLFMQGSIGVFFETKIFEGSVFIYLDKSYMSFSILEYKGKSLKGIFKVRNVERTTVKNKVGDDLILIKAKSNKVGRSFLSSPISRLILYSAIYVNEESNGEIVHENHLEELFPYLSTIDEISGRPNYESEGYTESKYSLFFSKEDFLAKIVGYFFLYKNWYLRGEGFLVKKIGEDIEFRELRIEEYLP